MTAWIVGIDRENPEHWAYAQQHGFWDMTKLRPFEVGDTLYFWQAGASLLGSVQVTIATQEMAARRGQPHFRRTLLNAYNGRCAVTDTGIQGLLEAAHISPYKGDHTDKVTNGLLLRADIHTLFDLHLLTVLPDYTVRLAPEVRTEPYAPCEGGRIRVPGHRPHRPDPEVLREHNSACRWLHERAQSEGVLF